MPTKNKKSFWSNGWVQGIGTALITFLITDGIFKQDYFITLMKLLLKFITNKYNTPLWLLILIFLAGVIITYTLHLLITQKKETTQADVVPKDLANYRADVFDGVLYRWEWLKEYYGDKYQIHNINSYCPKDKALLSNGKCLICHKYYETKDNYDLSILIIHKVDNNLFPTP